MLTVCRVDVFVFHLPRSSRDGAAYWPRSRTCNWACSSALRPEIRAQPSRTALAVAPEDQSLPDPLIARRARVFASTCVPMRLEVNLIDIR